MPPHDQATSTLVLPQRALARRADGDESIVRVLPVWAEPPDARVLVMLGDGPEGPAAALRVVRHRLEVLRARGLRTFGVTSARDAEGKSTFAVQLSLVLGEARRARVLLVEANLRKPALARILGFQVAPDLAGSAQIARRMRGAAEAWTVLAPGPALHMLAESPSRPGFAEALHTTHFQSAIESIGRAYDWVIVDAPSTLGSGDANVVESVVDGMILVVRSRVSRGADARAAMKQLGDRKTVGVVLWDADPRSLR